MAGLVDSVICSDVYKKINERFLNFTPQMDLKNYFWHNPEKKHIIVNRNTLEGIDFVPANADTFTQALESVTVGGEPAFLKGSTKPVDFQAHWAHSISLMATKGIGYRETWRMVLTDAGLRAENARPPLSGAPEMDRSFSGYFGEAFKINMQSLHVGVGYGDTPDENVVNVHIDDMGFEVADAYGNTSVIEPVGYHFFNELLLKDKIGKHLPNWFVTHLNFHFLSPDMGFNRIGASVDLYKSTRFKVTVSASCALKSCDNVDFSGIYSLDTDKLKSGDYWKQFNPTLNISGQHDLLGGGGAGWKRRRGR